MKIIVDGNDGLGKSTLVKALLAHGIIASDRGTPTKLTDDLSIAVPTDEFYLILDAPIEISRTRLAQAGKDLNERYHTIEDLQHYRERFREIAQRLGTQCVVIDATRSPESVLSDALNTLRERITSSTP